MMAKVWTDFFPLITPHLPTCPSATLRTYLAEVAADFFARPFALGFEIAALEIIDDAFKRLRHLISAQTIIIMEAHFRFVGAIKNSVLCLLRQLFKRRVEPEFEIKALVNPKKDICFFEMLM